MLTTVFCCAVWICLALHRKDSIAHSLPPVKQTNITDISISFQADQVTIQKNRYIYRTTFDQLFKAGFIEHDFKDDNKAKQTLLNYQETLTFKSHEYNNDTYINYHLDYFDIVIKVPNHLFDIDLENCSQEEQLMWYKNKYAEHVRILTINNYFLDLIKFDELVDSNFIFQIYKPPDIVYDHQGFIETNSTNSQSDLKTKNELNLLKSLYESIKNKYAITSHTFDNRELEISTYLSKNRINVTQNKYYKQLGNEIYFIKNNASPNIHLGIYHNKVHLQNLDLLYLQLKWVTCVKDISSYFIDLIDVLTKDQIITKLPVTGFLMDRTFESDMFIINVEGTTSLTQADYRNMKKKRVNHGGRIGIREYDEPTRTESQKSFLVSLIYKMVIQHDILILEYIGAIEYYDSSSKTVYKSYGKEESITIQFDIGVKKQKIENIQKYQNLNYYKLFVTESSANRIDEKGKHYDHTYSCTTTLNFPMKSITLYLNQ
eukprot:140012_1